MEREEKTVLDGRSKDKLVDDKFNSTELTGVETGQKLQVTVRLEAETIEIIEKIQSKHDFSFAETVRRLLKENMYSGRCSKKCKVR